MALLNIPICYVTEADAQKAVALDIEPEIQRMNIFINTDQICSYIPLSEENHTMVYMSNGTEYECEWPIRKFDKEIRKSVFIIPPIETN